MVNKIGELTTEATQDQDPTRLVRVVNEVGRLRRDHQPANLLHPRDKRVGVATDAGESRLARQSCSPTSKLVGVESNTTDH